MGCICYYKQMGPTWAALAFAVLVMGGAVCVANAADDAETSSAGRSLLQTATTITRREWRQLSSSEQAAYLAAVKALKAKAPGGTNPVTWNYDQFVKTHYDYAQYNHGSTHFLPWHRQLLRYYELALQTINPSIVVPYWDFTCDAVDMASSPLLTPGAFGEDGDPNQGYCVQTGPFTLPANWVITTNPIENNFNGGRCLQRNYYTDGSWIGDYEPSVQYNLYKSTSFTKLDQYIQYGPHGRLHVGIDGNMWFTTSSPNDPMFFMVHSVVDRLWWRWQTMYYPSLKMTWEPGPISTPMYGWGNPISDVLDTSAPNMNYNYSKRACSSTTTTGRRSLQGETVEPLAMRAMTDEDYIAAQRKRGLQWAGAGGDRDSTGARRAAEAPAAEQSTGRLGLRGANRVGRDAGAGSTQRSLLQGKTGGASSGKAGTGQGTNASSSGSGYGVGIGIGIGIGIGNGGGNGNGNGNGNGAGNGGLPPGLVKRGLIKGHDKRWQCALRFSARTDKAHLCYPNPVPDEWYQAWGMDLAVARQVQADVEAGVDAYNAQVDDGTAAGINVDVYLQVPQP